MPEKNATLSSFCEKLIEDYNQMIEKQKQKRRNEKRRSEHEVSEMLEIARKTNAKRSKSELKLGLASPERCSIVDHLRTAQLAIHAGITCYDWDAVAEAHEMLIDAINRIKHSQVKASEYVYTKSDLTKGN